MCSVGGAYRPAAVQFNQGHRDSKRPHPLRPMTLFFSINPVVPDIKASEMNSYYNPNPEGKNVGDCTVRALSKALDTTWEYTYAALALEGFLRHDMPSANAVWGAYLRECGFVRHLAPEDITVEEFAAEHQKGVFVLALSGHVVCITDGVLHDTWDSSQEIVLYYWQRG